MVCAYFLISVLLLTLATYSFYILFYLNDDNISIQTNLKAKNIGIYQQI